MSSQRRRHSPFKREQAKNACSHIETFFAKMKKFAHKYRNMDVGQGRGRRRSVTSMTKEGFSALVTQYERLVYTICFQLVRDAAAAEDLTQETFLSAYLHLDSMPPGYERQWLGRIAANKAKDHLQSAYNRHTVLPGDEGLPPGLAPPAEELALRRSGAAEITSLILEMKEPYLPVCRLCLLEEKSPEEAALALGRPLKTVHTQLSRGKRILREQLERSRGHDSISK